MYERYASIRDKAGVTDYEVAKSTGIGRSTFSDWKSGKTVPKLEKLQKIAHYFGVTTSYLIGETDEGYYLDPETASAAQELLDNPEMRILFDAARGVRAEDLRNTAAILQRLKETNPDG